MYGQETGKKPPATALPNDDRQVGLDEWDDIVADRFKVPKSLMKAVRSQESGGNVNAVSPTGVKGRYQVTEATAKQYGLDRNDPFQQSVAAAKHLRAMYDATPGDDDDTRWLGSVAKYYGGDNAVQGDQISGSSVDGVSNPARHVESVARKWGELRKAERQQQPQQPVPSTIAVGHSQQYKPLAQRPQPRTPSTATPNVFSRNSAQQQQQATQEAQKALDFRNVNPMAEAQRLTGRVMSNPGAEQRRKIADQYNQKSWLGQRGEDLRQGWESFKTGAADTVLGAADVVGRAAGGDFRPLKEAVRGIGLAASNVPVSKYNPFAQNWSEAERAKVTAENEQAMQQLAQERNTRQANYPLFRRIQRERQEQQLAREAAPSLTSRVTRGIGDAVLSLPAMVGAAELGGIPAVMALTAAQQDFARDPQGAALNTVGAGLPIVAGKAISPLAARAAGRVAPALQRPVQLGIEGAAGGAANVAQYAGTQAALGREIDPQEAVSLGITGTVLSGAMAPKLADVQRQNALRRIEREAQTWQPKEAQPPTTPIPPTTPDAPPTTPIPPAAAGGPKREDFLPGALGEGQYQQAVARAERLQARAEREAKKAKPMAAGDLRSQVDLLKTEAAEAENAGNYEAARTKYRSAQQLLNEMRGQAKRAGNVEEFTRLTDEANAANRNWQLAGNKAKAAGKAPAPQPVKGVVPPAEPLTPQADAPTRDLSAPLPAGEAKTPQPVQEITRTTAGIPNQRPPVSPIPEASAPLPPFPKLTPPTNRITEGTGAELPRRVSQPLEGQPIETPTRFTEYEGGEVQRYSRPLEGQPVEVPEAPEAAPASQRRSVKELAHLMPEVQTKSGLPIQNAEYIILKDAVQRGDVQALDIDGNPVQNPFGYQPTKYKGQSYHPDIYTWRAKTQRGRDVLGSLADVRHANEVPTGDLSRFRETGSLGTQPLEKPEATPAVKESLTVEPPAQPRYSPAEAAVREREALPPVERRRALRDAVPKGSFGKLSEAAYKRGDRESSLAENPQLRRLLGLPEMPPYRLPDAEINPKTGEPYVNPEWQAAAQDTLNAMAALAGKERSSQINFGAGDAGSRGEMGDLFLSVRKLAQQKGEPIEPALREAFKETVGRARTAQSGYQEFQVDERTGNIRNSLYELTRRGELTKDEIRAHQAAWREVAAEFGISRNQADELFKGMRAEARTRAERAGARESDGADRSASRGGTGRVVEPVEQRATGTEGGGRAAVQEAKPVRKAKPGTPQKMSAQDKEDARVLNDKAYEEPKEEAQSQAPDVARNPEANRAAGETTAEAPEIKLSEYHERRPGQARAVQDILEREEARGNPAFATAEEVYTTTKKYFLDSDGNIESSHDLSERGFENSASRNYEAEGKYSTPNGLMRKWLADKETARAQKEAAEREKIAQERAEQRRASEERAEFYANLDEKVAKLKGERGTLTIAGKEERGTNYGDYFFVHTKKQEYGRDKGTRWVLTHKPTGGLFTDFNSQQDVKRAIQLLSDSGIDWSFTKADKAAQKQYAPAKELLEAIKTGSMPQSLRKSAPEAAEPAPSERAAVPDKEVTRANETQPQAPDVARNPEANQVAGEATAEATPTVDATTPTEQKATGTPYSAVKKIIQRVREKVARKDEVADLRELRTMKVDDNPFAQGLRAMSAEDLATEITEMGGNPASLKGNKELMVRWLTREISRNTVAGEFGKSPDAAAKKAEFEELQRKPSPEQVKASALDKLKLGEDDAMKLMDTLAEAEKNAANPYLSAQDRARYNAAWDQVFDANLTDAELNRLQGVHQQRQKPKFVSDAEARLNEYFSGKRAGSGVEQLVDTTIVAGYKAYKAGVKFADWAKSVIDEVGERARPHLQKVWRDLKADKPEEQSRSTLRKQMAREALLRAKADTLTPEDADSLLQQMGAEAPQGTDPARFAVSLASALEKLGTNNVAEARNKVQKFLTPTAFGDAAQKFRDVAKAGRELRASGLTADEVWTLRDAVPLDQSRAAALTNRTPEQRSAAGQKAAQTRAANVAARQEQTRSAIAGVKEARAQAEAAGVAPVAAEAAREPEQRRSSSERSPDYVPDAEAATSEWGWLRGRRRAFTEDVKWLREEGREKEAQHLESRFPAKTQIEKDSFQSESTVSSDDFRKLWFHGGSWKGDAPRTGIWFARNREGAGINYDTGQNQNIVASYLTPRKVWDAGDRFYSVSPETASRLRSEGYDAIVGDNLANGPSVYVLNPDIVHLPPQSRAEAPKSEDIAARIARLDPTLTRAEIETYRNQQQKAATARQADKPEMGEDAALARLKRLQAAAQKSRFSFGELPNEPKGEVLGGGFGALQKAFDKLKAAPKDAPKMPADFDVSKYVGSIANQITPKMRQNGTVRNATIQLDPQGMREMADAANRLVDAQAKGDRAAMFQAKAQMDNVLMTAKRMQRRNDPLAKVRPELTEVQRWAEDKYRDGRITEQHRDNVLNAAEAVRIAAKIGDVEAIQQARRNLRDARRDMANRGVAGRVGFKTLNAASQVARSAQALTFGSDWSYIFRQAGPISLNPLNVVNTVKAFQMAYHAQGSETGKPQGKLGAFSRLFPGAKGAEWVRDQLTNHPMYKDAQRAGLETAIGSGADEIYRDSVVGKLPWVKRTEAANEAALDFLRLQEFGRYKKAIDAREGQSFIERQRAYEQAAEIINTLTGRTDLGDGKVKKAVEMLNGILSAPRLNVSRIKLLDPTRIVREIRANPAVGGRMAKDAMSVTATVAGALALGNYAGFWDVSLDPDDPDFAKARDGNTRYDVSFGMLPLLRLYFKTARYGYDMAKDAAQQTPRSERERKASGDKAGSAAKTFARGRLGPLYAYANDLWWGSNLIGEPVNLRQVPTLEKNSPARRLAIPLTYAEMGEMAAEGYKRQGKIGAVKGAAKATPAMVGIGVQQYDKTKKPSARR